MLQKNINRTIQFSALTENQQPTHLQPVNQSGRVPNNAQLEAFIRFKRASYKENPPEHLSKMNHRHPL